MYGDPQHAALWARHQRAAIRAAAWRAFKLWALGAAMVLSLLSTGVVWPP